MYGTNVAVLDLGSNSFHLVIAKIVEGGFEELVKHKQFVRLAEGGTEHISDDKFQFGLQTMAEFRALLNEHNVKHFKAFGTATLRTADNGQQFIDKVKNDYDINIELIDGSQEALYIYKGVRQAADLNTKPRLIMDIGGGSTEFIIANQQEVFWRKSYPIGAGVLRHKFHKSEPIAQNEYEALVNYLEETLTELWAKITQFKPIGLVGTSGAFKTLVNLERNHTAVFPFIDGTSEIVNLSEFKVIHLKMLKSTLEERLKIQDLEPARAPLITVATTLISLVISHLKPERSLLVSQFSLKEGVLSEMVEGMRS